MSNLKQKEKVVAIIGPTGVGKTEFSLRLAKQLNGEIVSCDSMQIYRGMDIGTAKATQEQREEIPHHCLDLVSIDQSYSVADYQKDGRQAIGEIINRGRFPIIVGGTGLYLRALLEDYDFSQAPKDEKMRQSLFALAEQKGNLHLHEKLKEVDSQSAEKFHPNDLRRIVRALEYFALTKEKISQQEERTKSADKLYHALIIGLNRPRPLLYERIDQRVDLMLEMGLLEEIEDLREQGLQAQSTPGQALGYKEFFPYFSGQSTLEDCLELLKRNSRRYAKRQLTWFRALSDIQWFDLEEYSGAAGLNRLLEEIISSEFFDR